MKVRRSFEEGGLRGTKRFVSQKMFVEDLEILKSKFNSLSWEGLGAGGEGDDRG